MGLILAARMFLLTIPGLRPGFCKAVVTCVTAACIAVRAKSFARWACSTKRRRAACDDVGYLRPRSAGAYLGHWRLSSFIANWPRSAARTRTRVLSSIKLMRQRWGPLLKADPFYNLNLGLERGCGLAFPPRRITEGKSRVGRQHRIIAASW
jgi:hypothetical protein